MYSRECGHIVFVYRVLLTYFKMGRHTPGASEILTLDFIDILLSGPTNSNFITLHAETRDAKVIKAETQADLGAAVPIIQAVFFVVTLFVFGLYDC